ncbi:arylesterase [Spiribacter roseus]|uniref:arylesterase n=1 Tax=Spiribacter roseus TaxID=1855875 RepID=UPI000F6ECAEC|nr:arylesterase [Spiribacter roseus]
MGWGIRGRLLHASCLLWLTLLVVGPAMGAGAADERVLVLGDSLSAAYNMPTESGWVAQLSERLGPDSRVINAAISGETTAGAGARLPAALERHEPSIVIIALGGNDGLRGISPAAMRDNLLAMIERSRAAGARVLLAGVRLPANYGTAFIERFRQVYRDVAERTGVRLIPMLLDGVAEDPSLMQSDGIHPNAKAQPIILQTVWSGLAPLLESDPEGSPAD